MKGVILDAASLGNDIDLSPILETLESWDVYASTSPSETVDRIRDAQVVLSNKVILAEEHFRASPKLRLIAVLATGTNNIDLEAARAADIIVSNARGYSTDSVVQHTLSLMFSLLGNTNSYQSASRDDRWLKSPFFCYFERPIIGMKGKTLGIVGYGSQGQALSHIAKTLGFKVMIAARRGQSPSIKDGVQRHDLSTVLKEADVLSLHCPLSPASENLISMAELKQMKRSAVLINCARGGIVHEQDLAEALNKDLIAGAGLDVLSQEPPKPDHPLIVCKHPNLIITPHIAWGNKESREALIQQTVANITGFVQGEPQNIVEPT